MATSNFPKCAVLICPNEADPRWYARDVNDHPVMICDGHEPTPQPSEVETAEIEAAIAAQWKSTTRTGVAIARCRYCGFEAFPFADATIEDHMKACRPEVRHGVH